MDKWIVYIMITHPYEVRAWMSSHITKKDMVVIIHTCHHTIDHRNDSPSWWRHQIETFSALLAISQKPVTRSFDVFFNLRLNERYWENNREAGDLRRHRAHYDVTVMLYEIIQYS